MTPIEPNPAHTSDALRPVGTQSTVDNVAAEIRRAYLAGALAPGEEFSMAELSSRLQVSHIPVREALRRLEAQGLVTLRPGRSAVVAPISVDEIDDVYRLWILLCNDAVARACSRYTEADLEELEALLDEFTSLPQDSEAAFNGHHQFHLKLVEPGASSWDLRLLEILWVVIERAVRLAYTKIIELAPGDPGARNYKEHRPLLDAACARDVRTLQRELRSHHKSHRQLVVDALEALQAPAGDGGDRT